MSKNIYEQYLSEEQLNNMRASDIRDLKEQETTLIVVIGSLIVLSFMLFVSLVALVLWFNKFTLFITIIGLSLALLFATLFFKRAEKYKESVKYHKNND